LIVAPVLVRAPAVAVAQVLEEAGMAEEWSEQQRVERLREIQAAYPDIDVTSLAAGVLAGPASPDRPPVPVWEYLEYLAAHPEISKDAISRTRFPVALYSGDTTVTSIAELLTPRPRVPTSVPTVDDVIDLYKLMHEAGAMRWNPETRTHEEVKPPASYVDSVYGTWRRGLQAKAARPGRPTE
jgi:hypothetical protein